MNRFGSIVILLASVIAAICLGPISAASASAKVCSLQSGSQAGAACVTPHGNEYTTGKLVAESTTAKGQKVTLTSGFINVTCDGRIEGEISHGGSGTLTAVTLFDCHSSANTTTLSCVAATQGSPYEGTATRGTSPNGTLDVNSTVHINFTCSGETCNYAATSVGTLAEIVITGGSTATLTVTKAPLTKQSGSGLLCSASMNWDGTYEVITPDTLYLT